MDRQINQHAKNQNLELNRIYKKQAELYHIYALSCGLSDAAFWVLYSLCETDETYTQNALAETWCLPKQTVNSAIRGLVRDGVIRLEPMPFARHSKAVFVTEKGREICRQHVIPLIEAEQRALSCMQKEEVDYFIELSEKQHQLLLTEFSLSFPGLKTGNSSLDKKYDAKGDPLP